jgi:hypothetical protein
MLAVLPLSAQNENQSGAASSIVKENQKAFLASDLDRYVVFDLMSDGTKVFKDTLDFNEYRDKAIFTVTQNQTLINYQLWAAIMLLVITVGLLIFIATKK